MCIYCIKQTAKILQSRNLLIAPEPEVAENCDSRFFRFAHTLVFQSNRGDVWMSKSITADTDFFAAFQNEIKLGKGKSSTILFFAFHGDHF